MASPLVLIVAGGVGACILIVVWAAAGVFGPGRARWLSDLPAEEPAGGWPRLAVIVAARNEETRIAQSVGSMLAQDYPNLEVIAVNDRSTDATGALLDRLAAEHASLRVIHLTTLPDGWLGKNHALQQGAAGTNAEWLLFTDADVLLAPLTLRRAVAFAQTVDVDHLVVVPQTVTEHEGERVFLTALCMLLALWSPPWKVTDPRSKVALGIGAFNLVRAEAFRAIGGLRRLALSVDDDLKLGAALKYAGFRPALVMGRGAVSVRWHDGIGGMIGGLEKNFFAFCDFRLRSAALKGLALVGLGVVPYIGLLVGPLWSRALALTTIVLLAVSLAATKGQNGIAWHHALVLPVGALACLFALLRSVWLTLRQGGVRWRDHFYPLDTLRAHVRQRNAWLHEVWRSTR